MILIGYMAGSKHGMCVCVYVMDVQWMHFQKPLEGHVFKSSSKHIGKGLRPVSHSFHKQDNSVNRHCERGSQVQFLADIHYLTRYSYSSILKFHYCQKGKMSEALCFVESLQIPAEHSHSTAWKPWALWAFQRGENRSTQTLVSWTLDQHKWSWVFNLWLRWIRILRKCSSNSLRAFSSL